MSAHILEHDARHRYQCVNPEHTDQPCHGVTFDSVTTILGKAVPKNLAWHGQTRGVIGVKGLLKIPKYDVRKMNVREIECACNAEGIPWDGRQVSPAARVKLSAVPKYDVGHLSAADITEALKRERLTVNDHRDQAAAGGTVMHKALEDYITRGIIPSAASVPENKRKSIQGLAQFILVYKPEFLGSEIKVLSVEHAFAGTFDFIARIHAELYREPTWQKRGKGAVRTGESVLKLRPHATRTLTILGDMKNSKWVYPSQHFTQLEAYEGARLEEGCDPTDVRAVLWLGPDGDMALVPSVATFQDFLTLKASAEVLGRLDKAWKRPRKAKA